MKYKYISIVIVVAVLLSSAYCAIGQTTNTQALAAADTSYFIVTTTDGWLLYNSYGSYNQQTDSVTLEVIIQHPNNLNLTEYQFIGKIKPDILKPLAERIITINLVTAIYKVKVMENGNCYLILISGTAPQGNDVILPIKISYKK